jgi:predicted regulator of Ras-like GTPase activity (Roadblock/LC7/MglB family)
MIVVLHQAVGVADPMISLIDMLQHVQKVDAVLIVSENGLLFVAAGGDVIDSTWVLYAKGARHAGTLAQKRDNIKTKDLTLILVRILQMRSHLDG